jgi:hypothetical protein
MTLAVDQPILNDPYQEPTRWWDYQQGQPVLMDGRRPAGYESEQDWAKESAARRWVSAVNHHGEFGRWALVVYKEPEKLGGLLGQVR